MVEHLNMILLTSSELYELRNNMKELKNDVSIRIGYCIRLVAGSYLMRYVNINYALIM